MARRISPLTAICMVVTICGSAAAAYFAAQIAAKPERHSHAHDHTHTGESATSGSDLHDWMHEQLDISAEQEKLLIPFETAFAEAGKKLELDISSAEKELATLVKNSARNEAEIDRILNRLDEAHAQLRRLTLEHFFVMETHLDAGQAERLRQWTHDSLIRQLQSSE